MPNTNRASGDSANLYPPTLRPVNETTDERAIREANESLAKAISDEIDRTLQKEAHAIAKKHFVKTLLCGQSESGKSTVVKQFQLLYNPAAFHAERTAWRLVILLNLLRSVRVLHEILSTALDLQDERVKASSPIHFGNGPPPFASGPSTGPSSWLSTSPSSSLPASAPQFQFDSPQVGPRQPKPIRTSDASLHTLLDTSQNGDITLPSPTQLTSSGSGSQSSRDSDPKTTKKRSSLFRFGSGGSKAQRLQQSGEQLDEQDRVTNSTTSTLSNKESISERPTTSRSIRPSTIASAPSPLTFTEEHQLLRMRLMPLVTVEQNLSRKLSASGSEVHEFEATHLFANMPPLPPRGRHSTTPLRPSTAQSSRASGHHEPVVRSRADWKASLARPRSVGAGLSAANRSDSNGSGEREQDDPAHILKTCADDIRKLWFDKTIRAHLERHRVRLEDSPGFFLDELERLVDPAYEPTDDDIVRARLKTIGVSEYRFPVAAPTFTLSGASSTFNPLQSLGAREWILYDVGGARTQRAAWLPYCETVDAIIFLAPLSAFDQALAEDPTINRMQDSMQLFKLICSSKLLKNVNLILFLNKMDLLEQKLNANVQVANYVRTFADRPNNMETVVKFFSKRFTGIYRENSPTKDRTLYVHTTSLTDRKSSAKILTSVCDSVIQMNLRITAF